MKRISTSVMVALGTAALLSIGARSQAQFTTVLWAPGTDGTGTGTGTLGSNTVTYNSLAAGNAGDTITTPWNTSLATASAVGTGVTSLTAGVLGTSPGTSPTLQTITFSSTITDPILLVDFAGSSSTMDFGALPISFLSSNNAQLAGDSVTFVGASKTSDDGFAALIDGTFGPATPLEFTYSTSLPFDSVGFTIGAEQSTPEPGVLGLLAAGSMAGLGLLARRRRK